MPESDVAAKAAEKAKKDAADLEAKKAKEQADAEARAAAAAAEAKSAAEASAAKAADEKAAAEKAAAERESKKPTVAEVRAAFRQKAARLHTAFQSPEVGLSAMAAAMLAAHCMLALEKPEHMGATEAIAWAKGFRNQQPIVWGALRIGHMMNFTAAMRRSGVDTARSDDLAEAASAILG